MKCPKCGYERQTEDNAFVAEGECPRCGVIYDNYLQASVKKGKLPSSVGESGRYRRGSEKAGGLTIAFIAVGVAFCCLAFYAAPLIKKSWDGWRWEAYFKEASDLYAQDRYQDAADPAKRALAGSENRFGPDKIELAGVLALLGKIHGEIGDYPGAVEYLERLWSIQEKTLGEGHADTRNTIKLLVSMHYEQGNSDKAEPLMSRLISLQEKELPAQIRSSSAPPYRTLIEKRAMGSDESPGAVRRQQVASKSAAKRLAYSQDRVAENLSKPHHVELYITSWCLYCKKAVKFFQARGIPYTAYDIEKDQDAARRKNQLDSRRGVPFAIIDGQKIHGFSEASYRKALNQK